MGPGRRTSPSAGARPARARPRAGARARPAVAAIALLALAACSRGAGPGAAPEAGDRPAAKVEGETVWMSDVRRQAAAQGLIGEGERLEPGSEPFRRSLDELIDQKLLAREAERLKLADAPVAQRRLETARERLLGDMLVESVVDKAVNDNAIRALYEEQRRVSQAAEELRARQIVVGAEADAQAVRKLLDTGASFEALALQRSTDQATRFNGGDLGYFTLESMPMAYAAALKSAKVGEVIGPVAVDAGWAVMRVEDRRPEPPITVEEARPQIVRFLTYDQIRSLLTRLRGQSRIEILNDAKPARPAGPAKSAASSPAKAAS